MRTKGRTHGIRIEFASLRGVGRDGGDDDADNMVHEVVTKSS